MHRYRQRARALAAGSLLVLLAACASRIVDAPRSATQAGAPATSPSAASEPARPVEAPPAAPQPVQSGAARAEGPSASAGAAGNELDEITVTGSRRGRAPRTADTGGAAVASPRAFERRVVPFNPALAGNLGQFLPAPFVPGDAGAWPPALSAAEPGEEIWFIASPGNDAARAEARDAGTLGQLLDDTPGSGALLANLPAAGFDAEPKTIPLPLEHTDVRATIRGYVGTVDVTQQFGNPYDEKIEAVYMFPLPEKAAVREFVMTIGDRKIRGILREKEEAEQLYYEARAQGYQASLLTQHRPNVFEQKVANIEPGKRIDVNIRYFHTLAYHDGWYSFVFPTVVGPRYNPPGWHDPLAAAPRADVEPRERGEAVRYLRPDERSAHDISIRVDVDAGVAIEELESSHAIEKVRDGESRATIELAGGETIPNRDFVLSFRVAGETIKSNLLTYTDPETNEGYFTLMVYPPADLEAMERQPVEMVFVIDTSGSMSGRPIEQAKAAVLTALDRLGPEDTFQVIRFSSDASRLGAAPVPATAENLRRARQYVESLQADGGTEMLSGIRAALAFPHDAQRLRFVTFMTDGFIGNEVEIIGEVHRLIGESRIFSFGVGNSVNRFLLERMASEGKGAVAYLGLEDSADEVMSFFFERISHPALLGLSIDWGTMQASDVYPSRLPDLFVGRPVFVTGKFSGRPDDVTVRGTAGGRRIDFSLAAGPSAPEQSFIASLWARLRIADLADRQAWGQDPYEELARQIRETALDYGLMSQYTAFVAVDASAPTTGTSGTTVYQAVPVPDGVRYETTVGER